MKENHRGMKMYKYTLIIILLIANLHSFAQETGTPFIKHYKYKEYAGSEQVWCAVQDNLGVMYFGDNSGIIEFDGRSWKRIAIRNNVTVRSLAIDHLGRIYVGATSEFGYLQPNKNGELHYISLSEMLDQKDQKFSNVWKTLITKNGVYFITPNCIFRYFQGRISKISIDLKGFYGFDVNNTVYVVEKNKGIFYLNDTLAIPLSGLNVSAEKMKSIISFPGNKLLINDSEAKWWIYDRSSFHSESFNTQAQEYLSKKTIYFTQRIGDTKFAVVTCSGEIIVLFNNGEISTIFNKDNGFNNSSIYSLFIDHEENIWACTANGIDKIDINYPAVFFDDKHGLDGYVLSCTTHNNKTYVGTLSGLYYRSEIFNYNDFNKNFIRIGSPLKSCWNFNVFNNILFAACAGNLVVIQDSLVKNIYGYSGESAYCIGENKKFPDVLFLSTGNKLRYIRLNAHADFNSIKVIEEYTFPEIKESISTFVSDNDNNLWASTKYNGIYFIRFLDSSPKNYKITHLGKINGLTDLNDTRSCHIDNEIYICTKNGILKPEFTVQKTLDSLIQFKYTSIFNRDIDFSVEHVVKVDENKYLINGEKILYATKTTNGVVYDSAGFNRLKNDFELYEAYINHGKSILFGASQALIKYSIDNQRNFDKTFYTVIRKVVIGKDSVIIDGGYFNQADSVTTRTINQPSQVLPSFAYNYNSITFHFAGLFFEAPHETQFCCKLEGYNDEWSNWNTDNKAIYTNLHEGKYTFYVKAKNIYGAESNIAQYSFSVLPPYYRTWWAYLIYTIFGVFFIFLIVILNSRRISENNKLLEKKLKERTAELVRANDQLERLASERMKELFAVYNLEHLIESEYNVDKNVFRQLLKILIESWQYPEITCARIIINDDEYKSENFVASKWVQSALIKIDGEEVGKIEIAYTEQRPKEHEGPFLKEERMVLNTIAARLGYYLSRKKAQEELLKLRKAIESSGEAFFITNKDGIITYINPGFTAIYGYEADEVVGKLTPRILKSGLMKADVYETFWNTLLNGQEVKGTLKNKRKDGLIIDIEGSSVAIYDESKNIIGFLSIQRDITARKVEEEQHTEKEVKSRRVLLSVIEDQKKAREELIIAKEKAEESDRLKSAFLANMSHEIRTPLNSIIGFSDLLVDPDFEPEQKTEFLQLIHNSGDNLLAIISDIIDISKIETGQLTINKIHFSVEKLINEIFEENNLKAIEKGVDLRINFADRENTITLHSDPSRLKQILTNFVSNSIKFTERGYVEIGFTEINNSVQISVKDTGIGIPRENHEHIFERFRQVESAHTRKYGGNGLGLAISKQLADLLGYKLWMESEAGKGSIFYLSAPKNIS